MEQKKRIVWIDQLKGIAFIFVIIGHLSINNVFKSWIYSFHMPLFFFATGMTLNIEKVFKTSFKDYFLTHAKRMLIPYFWMQMLSFCLREAIVIIRQKGEVPVLQYLLGILAGNNNIIGSPSNPLYYVLVLFLAEIALWAIIKICGANKTAISLVGIFLLPVGLILTKRDMIWHINCVPAAVFFILIGTHMMSLYKAHREKLEKMNIVKYGVITLALFSFGFICWKYNGRFSLHGNYYGKDFLIATLAAVTTSTAIAFCVMKLPQTKLFTFVGQNTLFYMGIHKPLLLVFETLFPKYTENPYFIIGATIACYLILIPVTMLAKKVAPFVLGIFTEQPNALQKFGQFAVLFASFIVPFNFFLNHFKDGILKSGTLYAVLSFAAYAALTALVWLFTSKLIPVIYLSKRLKSKSGNNV